MNVLIVDFVKKTIGTEQRLRFIESAIEYIKLLDELYGGIHPDPDLVLKQKLNRQARTIRRTDFYLREKYLINSFKHYVNKNQEMIKKNDYSLVKNDKLVEIIKRSFENIIYTIYTEEKSNKNTAKPKIALFEASPIDSKSIKSAQEINNIAEFLLDTNSRYFPIVRFSTNTKILKETVKNNNLYGIHFAGHGNTQGIILLNAIWNSYVLTSNNFEDFFDQNTSPIQTIYLNACYTDKFAEDLVNSTTNLFVSSIGFQGKINDDLAKEFSELLYEHYSLLYPIDINEILSNTKESYELMYSETPRVAFLEQIKKYKK